jgi:serine/threonine protein kinase
MLEIVAGFPLWFPYKSRVPREGRKDFWVKGGLLAVGAREPFAICRKQTQIADNVAESLKTCPGRGLSKDTTAMHFLSEMLTVDPHQRVRPADQLEHPWLEGVVVE